MALRRPSATRTTVRDQARAPDTTISVRPQAMRQGTVQATKELLPATRLPIKSESGTRQDALDVLAGAGSSAGRTADRTGQHRMATPTEVSIPRSAPLSNEAQRIEDFVFADLEAFWRWCPVPVDGLHRCGLLVKLFDYAGLTQKGWKTTTAVQKLNKELYELKVCNMEKIVAHQRIPYQDFVQSRKLREAIAKCQDVQKAWVQHCSHSRSRRSGSPTKSFPAPLSTWVLQVIGMQANAAAPGVEDARRTTSGDGIQL